MKFKSAPHHNLNVIILNAAMLNNQTRWLVFMNITPILPFKSHPGQLFLFEKKVVLGVVEMFAFTLTYNLHINFCGTGEKCVAGIFVCATVFYFFS